MATLVIDPVSRLEGHLRLEIEYEGGAVVRARSSGTSFRGLENVMRGRDPRDAAQITQRICGVCPVPHGRAACEAFENAAGLTVSPLARLVRNVVQAANFVDSHLLHFYVLSLPDYVAGLPTAGAWPPDRAPAAWRAARRLDAGLLAAHAAEALRWRRACQEIVVALAGKMPHATGLVPGGATAVPSAATLADLRVLAAGVGAFARAAYADDARALARAFPEYAGIGASGAAFLAHGSFPHADGSPLLPGGLVLPGDASARTADVSLVRESTASARYAAGAPAHPSVGTTEPAPRRSDAYSWVKAPRLSGHPCEVGPLARAVVSGRHSGAAGVMARHVARQRESVTLAGAVESWLDQIAAAPPAPSALPDVPVSGAGVGLTEAPRGALGHWVTIEASATSHYGVVSPTTWNASPRDEAGVPGPMERALEGVRVADPADPIEVVRVVHSFDPCLQCAVH